MKKFSASVIEDQKVNFYISEIEDDEWGMPKLVEELKDEFDHVANGTLGPDGYLYYTKCLTDYKHDIHCELYKTKEENGVFSSKGQKLKGKINKRGYSSTQPTFGKHKKRLGRKYVEIDVLYFSSNRPGGVGGMDIWYSVYEDGKFHPPVNCGKRVNTVRDEVSPYYNSENQQLHFSSNYHYGFGGFDVFVIDGKMKKFKKYQKQVTLQNLEIVQNKMHKHFMKLLVKDGKNNVKLFGII